MIVKIIIISLISLLLFGCYQSKTKKEIILTGQYQSDLVKTKKYLSDAKIDLKLPDNSIDRIFGVMIQEWTEENMILIIHGKNDYIPYREFTKLSNNDYRMDEETELVILNENE